MANFMFTSESVSEGHPDKVADQISDAVLDSILDQDTGGPGGLRDHGHHRHGRRSPARSPPMPGSTCPRSSATWSRRSATTRPTWASTASRARCSLPSTSSLRISRSGVNEGSGLDLDQGAGDQGLMFGYACDETKVLMPMPITYAHMLTKRQAEVRKTGRLPWLRPDAKSQVTIEYENDKPKRIEAVVLSTQHSPAVDYEDLKEGVMEEIIKPILPESMLDKNTKYFINPTGRFVIGGPVGDCGVTGRKIIVDTYGGKGSHGGGAFSGKDPSKVDRSSSYMGRYVAKNLVAAGIASEVEVQIAYAIGISQPVSVNVLSFGTGKISDEKIAELVREHFDLRPKAIIQQLDLLRPIYRKTAAYGHFGRERAEFTWERTDKADDSAGGRRAQRLKGSRALE